MKSFALSSVTGLLTAAAMMAQSAPSPDSGQAKARASVKMISMASADARSTGGSGIVAVLENGVYREATPAEMAALRGSGEMQARAASSSGILVTPDGRIHGALVPDSLFSGTVAVMGADGKIQTRCVTGKKAQEAVIRQGSKRRTFEVADEK